MYTSAGNPASLAAPEVTAADEVRYLTGQAYATLATATVNVTPVSATLAAPPTAPARAVVAVTWEGPGNPTDYVILLPVGANNEATGNYAYVSRGKELRIATPDAPGEYEVRYLTGNQRITLGKRAITIAPRPAPGTLRVVAAAAGKPVLEGATVAVVFDASGSMLQRRRGAADRDRKPAVGRWTESCRRHVGFWLRVFGDRGRLVRTDNECRRRRSPCPRRGPSSIDRPRTREDPDRGIAAADRGRSCRKAAAGRDHYRTDGEETCGGDPEAEIADFASPASTCASTSSASRSTS